MSQSLTTVAYLGATILFILSLGGLSNPESSRRGNLYGIIGMGIAIVATLTVSHLHLQPVLLGAIAVGAALGAVLAIRVGMTQMPELVALLHSFVGIAAVLVGYSLQLEADRLGGGMELKTHIEIYVDVFIGAVTFTGSIVAYGKLAGRIDAKPLTLPMRHQINLGAGDNLAAVIVAARRADVVRALQLAARRAFVRIARNESVMRAAHVAAGAGHAVLLNGHVNL